MRLFNNKGQGVLEVLIAMALLTIAISSIIVVSYSNQSVSVDTENSNQALYIAKSSIEAAKAAAKADFSSVTSSTTINGIYTVTLTVQDVSLYEKKVTSTVTWATDPRRTQKVEIASILTAPELVVDLGGDDGGTGLSGDWRNPRTLGSIDLGPGNQATGLDVKDKYVYMSATASSEAKPDFFIIDATDGSHPSILSSLNTGPGLNAVDFASGYGYVANNKTSSQLQIVNAINRSSPVLTSSLTLPGVSGTGAVGKSIFYAGNKVYIGTNNAAGPEFHIIDVSNPSSPSELGSFEIGADINNIIINGTKAYLATSNDNKELVVLNISNPATIAELGSYNATGNADGLSLYLVGTKIYLGRAISSSSTELFVLDITNPASIQSLGNKEINSDVTGLNVRDYLAFLGTNDSNTEFQVWNINDPANITFWSSFNFPQVVSDIDYENNIVYVSVRSNDALRIITSQ